MPSPTRLVRDRVHQALKRTQRRFLLADYEDLRLRERWLRGEEGARYEERAFTVAPDLAAVESLLVFKADEIGDAVYALPAVSELKRHAPQARLFLVCRPLTAPLYERTGLFDEISTFEPGSRLVPAPRRLRQALSRLSVDEFDLSVFLRTGPRNFREFRSVPARARLHALEPRLRSSSVFRARVSLWGDRRRHTALQLLEIVSLATGKTYGFEDVVFPPFRWTEEDREALSVVFDGGTAPARFGVLHPFAQDETRRYPLEYWPRLMDELRAVGPLRDLAWIVIGGREDGRFDALGDVVQAQGRLTLMQTAYLLSHAEAFIGNISGPAHLAAALGVPTVTLMSGHSLPVEWGPLGDSLILRADVPCAPCHQATCPVYGLACLTELRPNLVAPEIAAFYADRTKTALSASLRSVGQS